GEARVRGERERREDRGHARPIHEALPEDPMRELREDTLVTGRARVRGDHVLGATQKSHPDQKEGEERQEDTERPARADSRWLAEVGYAVAHGLDARHGGAAVRERAEQEPGRDSSARRRQRRGERRARARYSRTPEADADDRDERKDERIRGERERSTA